MLHPAFHWLIVTTATLTFFLATKPSVVGQEAREQPATEATASDVSFRNDIAPILLDNCLACHGPKKAEGGYRVDNFEELLKPGDSGEQPVSADGSSELLRRLDCDESERMPAESEPLGPEQIAKIKKWIEAGATFDGSDPRQTLALVIPAATFPSPPESYSRAVPVAATIFAPDGEHVVVGGYHELTIWKLSSGTLERRIGNIGQRVFALAFGPDHKTLAVACGEPGKSGEVRLIDYATGEVTHVLGRTSDVVLDIAFRPNSSELAVASADSMLRIYDVDSKAEVRAIASHADWVTAVAWSDDGSRLASASRDKSAKVYDGATGELLASYLGHGAAVRGISILNDNQQVVSAGDDHKIHRWAIEGAKKIAEVGVGGSASKLLRRENLVLFPCSDKRLLQFDLTNNTITQAFAGHADWVLSAAVRNEPSGSMLVSGAINGEVRLWNLADGSLLHSWIAKP